MVKASTDNMLIRQATRMGLEKMLNDMELLLKMDLTEGQRVTNEEMKNQLLKFLGEYK